MDRSRASVGVKTKLLLFLGSLVLSIVLAEAALHMAGMYGPPRYPPKCIYVNPTCDLYEKFEPYGYRLKPSRATRYFYPYLNPNRRNLSMVSNRHGFRSSREFSQIDGRLRIIVIGDSQVFGEGVEEEERFTNFLENMYPAWRVDNLGMPGYGLDLMLRALEEIGLRLTPDVVIFSIYAGDFHRVRPYYAGIGVKIPRFKLKSGELVTVPYPEPYLWNQLRIFQMIRHVYWRYSNAERELNMAILDRFIKLSEQYSFIPVIIFIPLHYEESETQENRVWLQQYAKRHDIPFLDLTDSLSQADWKQVLIENNPHLNPYGHQIIANVLRVFLAKEVLKTRRSH